MKRVLCIDGGGIRGLIPALVLAEIEARTDAFTADLFDMIAGTSTGGIIALVLSRPGVDGPAYTAGDVAAMYLESGWEIFSRSFWKGVSSIGGLADEKYSDDGLMFLLEQYLAGHRLVDALTHVLITSYNLEARKPFFFKSWCAPGADYLMRSAARATSAAPTYFEPLRLSNEGCTLVDGGVFVNNPAMCAYAEARRLWPDEEIMVVSLGTGELTRPITYQEAKDWGLAQWAAPILNVVFDGVSDAVDYQLGQILGADYYRIQGRLDVASDDMDNTSAANLAALCTEAEHMIENQDEELNEICDRLSR